ncbi:hypothetical protein Tco_0597211 [Tanacetum coccineum]
MGNTTMGFKLGLCSGVDCHQLGFLYWMIEMLCVEFAFVLSVDCYSLRRGNEWGFHVGDLMGEMGSRGCGNTRGDVGKCP